MRGGRDTSKSKGGAEKAGALKSESGQKKTVNEGSPAIDAQSIAARDARRRNGTLASERVSAKPNAKNGGQAPPKRGLRGFMPKHWPVRLGKSPLTHRRKTERKPAPRGASSPFFLAHNPALP